MGEFVGQRLVLEPKRDQLRLNRVDRGFGGHGSGAVLSKLFFRMG